MKSYLSKTNQFLDRQYENTTKVKKLSVGDICIVHPTPTSQSKKPYKVQIVFEYINWVDKPSVEICTSLHSIFEKGHTAVLNEYLFNKLEPIN